MEAIEIGLTDKLDKLPAHTRVWIYQSSKALSEKEVATLRTQLSNFVSEWSAHSRQLAAVGDVLFERFLVLAVDEQQEGASGCSIDTSVRFLKDIESLYHTQLFDRMNFAFLAGEDVEVVSSTEFAKLYTEGVINDSTLVFDNLVQNIGEMKTKWLKPLAASWHKRFV